MVHLGFGGSFVEFFVLRDGICQAELPNHWVDVVARGFIRLEQSELGTASIAWLGGGLGGLTQIFFAIPIVLLYAVQENSFLP